MSIFKRVRNGQASEFYYFKFVYQGREIRQCAETTDKKVALAREREARAHAIAGRWNEIRQLGVRTSRPATRLGELLRIYRERATVIPITAIKNISALRCLVRVAHPDVQLEDLPVSALTDRLVRDYKSALLATAGQDQAAQERMKTTANSTYRQARSIFCDPMLQVYADQGIELGDALKEFRNVPLFSVARRQYKRPPTEVITRILRAAFVGSADAKPLRETDPNAFKAFLLALGMGLRKNAASHARYSWITELKTASIGAVMLGLEGLAAPLPEHGQKVLLVQIEPDFRPKGRDEQMIPMDEFIFDQLMALRVPTADPNAPQYILHGNLTERKEEVWRRLSAWMQALGWDRRMTAHELRKLYGSEVASAHGIYAAQKLLGHKDANLTSSRYADINQLPDVKIFGH